MWLWRTALITGRVLVYIDQATSHYLNRWWLDYRRIYASLGLNGLTEPTMTCPECFMVRPVDEAGYRQRGCIVRIHPLWYGTSCIDISISDAMLRHRSVSTLVHVMASCLTTPSHYLNHCWLLIDEVLWHSHVIYLTTILQQSLMISIHNTSLKVTLSKLLSHLPWIN